VTITRRIDIAPPDFKAGQFYYLQIASADFVSLAKTEEKMSLRAPTFCHCERSVAISAAKSQILILSSKQIPSKCKNKSAK
jgi:hypothetical protein